MSTITIVFVLIILLFGFDSTGQVKGPPATQSRLRTSSGAEGSRKKSQIFWNLDLQNVEEQITNQIK